MLTFPTRRRFIAAGLAASLVAGSALLAGCGQKGPLYLPEDDTAGGTDPLRGNEGQENKAREKKVRAQDPLRPGTGRSGPARA